MTRKFFIVFFVFVYCLKGFSNEKLFEKGIEFYNNQNYQKALIYFDSINGLGFSSAELYYNIGNCYYKQNELGKAILFYEKAKKLNPDDDDIIHNINFCNRLIRDKAGKVHESPLNRLFFGSFSTNTYGSLALMFSLLAAVFIILKLILPINNKIRITIIVSALLLALSFLSLAHFTNNYQTKERYAIVIPSKTNIHVEPKEESKVTFVLHEGSKVEILESLNDWKKIKFGNGKVGWISVSGIEII